MGDCGWIMNINIIAGGGESMIIDKTIRAVRPSRGSLVYLLETDLGIVIIDTGSETKAASFLLDYVRRRLSRGPEQIRYIFLTHWHGDHAGGAERIRELTGARIICHRDDSPLLAGKGEIDCCWSKPMPHLKLKNFYHLSSLNHPSEIKYLDIQVQSNNYSLILL